MAVVSEWGMEWTRLVVLDLEPGETYEHACGDAEWIVLPLAGSCRVRCAPPPPESAPAAGAPDPERDSAELGGAAPATDRGSAPGPAPQAPAGLHGAAVGGAVPVGEWGSGSGCASRTPVGPGGAGAGESVFEVRGRRGVFGGSTDFVYVPRDSCAEVTAAGGGRFALVGARCERRLPVRYRAAEEVAVELRGSGSCSRQVNNFAAAGPGGFDCDRLIAVEVITPGGNWSSYPPHKHDEHRPGEESRLEEIYYFEIAPHGATPGVGYQRVTPSPAGRTDVLTEVRTGDAVLIPDGWHGPSIAAPGHDMYYLNVMAGPGATREWLIRDHPDHAWIRATWPDQQVDPRLPFPPRPEER